MTKETYLYKALVLIDNLTMIDSDEPLPICNAHFAKVWLKNLYSFFLTNHLAWDSPLISRDEDDIITFEWWHDLRKLTVYANPKGVECIKVWGADMINEMDDVIVKDVKDMCELLKWLKGNTWQGDDFEECLQAVKDSRSGAFGNEALSDWIRRALPILRSMKDTNIQALMFKYERFSDLDWEKELTKAKENHATLTELVRIAEEEFDIKEKGE